MVREYRWRLRVRSYEGDAWGQVPASGLLRYMEQSAIDAAADAGYGSQFHRGHGTAWVVRRMLLLIHAPARAGENLEITTWISHFARVRGGREYRIANLETEHLVAEGLAEWVYLDRRSSRPLMIPPQVAADFDTPGAPLGSYEFPTVELWKHQTEHVTERTVEWHELDSMEHVNNAVYADWLDEAVRSATHVTGWSTAELKEHGVQLRGEGYKLDYKREALPGERVTITTRRVGGTGRLQAFHQSIVNAQGTELLSAQSVYGWRTNEGQLASPPALPEE